MKEPSDGEREGGQRLGEEAERDGCRVAVWTL